jgi:ubiquinone/menaquinone biosynthesis C-methylase UbiE
MNVFIKPEIASKYDLYYQTEIGKKVNQIEEKLITDLLKDIPRTKMLELGCGTGHWTNFFLNKGYKVTATDISDAMLQLAKQKNLNANFIKADSLEIPFEDNSFDIISSITMLEFVEDQDKVLEEIQRVLKPGGYFILGSLNALSAIGKNKEQDDTFRNAKFLSKEELIYKLKRIGEPSILSGVYFSPNFELLDNLSEIDNVEPAFFASLTQKTK